MTSPASSAVDTTLRARQIIDDVVHGTGVFFSQEEHALLLLRFPGFQLDIFSILVPLTPRIGAYELLNQKGRGGEFRTLQASLVRPSETGWCVLSTQVPLIQSASYHAQLKTAPFRNNERPPSLVELLTAHAAGQLPNVPVSFWCRDRIGSEHLILEPGLRVSRGDPCVPRRGTICLPSRSLTPP